MLKCEKGGNMHPLEIVVWMLFRGLYYLKKFLLLVLFITIIVLICKFNSIYNYFDSLNVSFYIKKYDLMQIISGIITGLITFMAMKYIDDLNKNRIYKEKLIKQKMELEQNYEELLNQFFDNVQIIQNAKQGYVTVNNQADFIEILSNFSNISFNIFKLLEKMEKFFPIYKMDFYTHRLYRYKYISRGADKVIDEIKNNNLEYLKNKDSHTIYCPKIEEIIAYRWPVENLDKIKKDVYKELMGLSKKSRSL